MLGRQPPAVGRVLERVVHLSRRDGLFHTGDTVMVACSGGPDSTCLLHALHRVRRLLRLRLVAFHFDHRLRPGSDRDAAYVKRQARSLDVPFVFRRAAGEPAGGQSVEAWGRAVRYAALTAAAREAGANRAALGHTMDDQAETVLLGLARGGGLEALAAMAPLGAIPPIGFPAARPLLETSRAEVAAFNRALRLRPRQDPSNRDRRFLRNRVRLDVLPMLERRLDRGLRTTLARTAAHLREDAELLEALAVEAAERVVDLGEDQVRLDVAVLASLPRPIAARVVRLALRSLAASTGRDTEAGTAHIDGVLDLAGGRPGRRLDLPGDLAATRVRGYVRLSRPSPERPTRKGER
jgi:tRNA(Ile)-lysidine synthase